MQILILKKGETEVFVSILEKGCSNLIHFERERCAFL